ncbi:uncharacterized protein N7477_008094 [Penicillium maclennaniae]|uniref:uncharacterized protein n=1 Tax=Penicillium maclennaniae TaxID=1343394 RepID=UPI0025419A08|nr:uncharacterized protein N7477_008094 [Penicillium maclennaniae]KAJ5665646.1 hypothetical protein N7477_008094 [Penicillium maclennaniae]
MSSNAQSSSQASSAKPRPQRAMPRGYIDPNQDVVEDQDLIHHLYFEDNDPFFPPAWLGKDIFLPERRPSNESTSSTGSKDDK